VEVERPRRRDRRAGKSDRIDAIAAAKSVLTDERVSTPRRRGILTAIRALLIARRSAVAERTRVLNQLHALNATAPTSLRERIGAGTGKQLERRLLSMRTRPNADLEERTVFAVMRDLAAHSRALGDDAKRYQQQLAELITTLDNTLLDEAGIGPISAAKLLACDPSRFKNESAFARCNGTAPIPASSGKTIRYRLNPGGDRQANNAIHTIAIIRAKHQPETRAYLERRIKEGKTRREALRSLKRHISRELYHRLAPIPLTS
jgi:transposase